MQGRKLHQGGFLSVTLICRRPGCRERKLLIILQASVYKNMTRSKTCPVYGKAGEIEVGSYYGTSFASYLLTVSFSGKSLADRWKIIGLSVNDNRFSTGWDSMQY